MGRMDNFPDDFSGYLPGEKPIECNKCGEQVLPEKSVDWCEYNQTTKLYHNTVICRSCAEEMAEALEEK